MDSKLRDKIREAAERTDVRKSDFVELLRLIDEHYDKMEATITQSLNVDTPIEAIFDSVTEALISVGESGEIRVCNKVCAHYFGLTKDQLIGSKIEHLLPATKGKNLAKFLKPFMSNLDQTHIDYKSGELDARRANGEEFVVEINASELVVADARVFVISLRDITGSPRGGTRAQGKRGALSRTDRERAGSNHCIRRRRESVHRRQRQGLRTLQSFEATLARGRTGSDQPRNATGRHAVIRCASRQH